MTTTCPEQGFVQAVDAWADRTPEGVAIESVTTSISYAELARRVRRAQASRLHVPTWDSVSRTPIGVDAAQVAAIVAAFAAGRALRFGPEGVTASAGDPPTGAPNEGAAIVWTAGASTTTATGREVLDFLAWAKTSLALGPVDRVGLALPVGTSRALLTVLAALQAGATLVVPAAPLEPHEVVAWLARERISVVHTVASQSRAWAVAAADRRLPTLRHAFWTGAPLAVGSVAPLRALAPTARVAALHARPGTCAFTPDDLSRPPPSGVFSPEGSEAHAEDLDVELQAALLSLPHVTAAAVVRDAHGEPAAFVAGRVETVEWHRTLRSLLRGEDPQPRLVLRPALPMTAAGEIDRGALLGDLARPTRRDEADGPTEAAVLEEWRILLGPHTGPDDDFFLAGGHSLLAAQLAARLSARLHTEIPLAVFFAHTTAAEQAAWIDRAAPGEARFVAEPGEGGGRALSHGQERQWFFERMHPGTTVNHVQWRFAIEGELDPARLEAAMVAVADRHEALRTVFRETSRGPRQFVLASTPRQHEDHDLRGLGEGAQAAALQTAAGWFRVRFDLERGPTWRTLLFRTGPRTYLLSIQAHHIVSDAWSLNVWMTDLAETYGAMQARREPRLPVLAEQPAGLAAAERALVASEALQPDRDFWRKALEGLPGGVDLPVDRPRPDVPSYRGVFVPLTVPASLVARLREVGRTQGATLFVTLLSALSVLLCRVADQTDLVVGVPVSGRERAATRDVMGHFLNNVPVRVDASGDPPFTELLARARDAARAALSHATLPFERIVADAPNARAMGHPLFNVMLNLVPQTPGLVLPGLRIESLPGRNESSPLDLMVTLRELEDGSLVGNMRAAADLFDPATAERMAARLSTVLSSVAHAPSARVSRAAILDPEERALLTERWNATGTDAPFIAVADLAIDVAQRNPAATALRHEGRSWTFGEVGRKAAGIAAVLASRALAREALVAVLARRSPDLPAAMVGILRAGCAFVLLDPDLPQARVRAMLDAARPQLVLADRALADRLPLGPNAADVVWLDTTEALAIDAPSAPRAHVRPHDLAYVLFTSGSSGLPKAVETTQGGLSNRLAWVRRLFPFSPHDVLCHKTPLGFIDAIWELLAPLCDGTPCVLASEQDARDPAALCRTLEREGVTRLMLVPSLLRAILALHQGERGWLPKLTLWWVGGEEVSSDLARGFAAARPDAKLVNLFGLTEVSGEATWHTVEVAHGARIPIGRPGPDVRTYVLDATGELAPVGVWGQLAVGGRGVSRGYLGDADLTNARFVPDPFATEARATMFMTGDRARWRADGVLEYGGRLDDQLKIHGVRVDPHEVELAVRGLPGVGAGIVVARPSPAGTRLVAYVTRAARDAELSPSTLRRRLRQLLPLALVPHVVVLDDLPLSAHDKVDRSALPDPDLARVAPSTPKTATEVSLAELWGELLQTRELDADDDFFAQGGYSLLLGQLAARIRATFLVDLPLSALMATPTLGGQAEQIDLARARGDGGAALEDRIAPAPRTERLPLSFAQERLWVARTLRAHGSPDVVALRLRLVGPLDDDRLERSIDVVAERHEALRTVFGAEHGVPFQTVRASLPRRHARVDLRTFAASEQEREAEVARRAAAELGTPFELAEGPPWRTQLLRLGPDERVLFVTMSHLVSDATSMRVWLDEVSAVYGALDPDRAGLEPVTLEPADFAVWQRKAVAFGRFDADRAYFRNRLSGAPSCPPLPADGPRGGHVARWVKCALPSATFLGLRRLAHAEAATFFALLLAAVGALVADEIGERTVTLGTLTAGRDAPGTETIVGAFVNPLPVRFAVGSSFAETIGYAQEASIATLAHGSVPFERIVADTAPAREPGRHPLFDVALNYVPYVPEVRFGAARAEALDPPATVASPFELMWRFYHRRDGLHVALEYREGRYADVRAQAWLDRLVRILELGATAPHLPHASVLGPGTGGR